MRILAKPLGADRRRFGQWIPRIFEADLGSQGSGMPSRFTSGLYDPTLVNLMSAALEAAWSKYVSLPGNADLGRQIMATAIIDAVDIDERSLEALARAAVCALDEAMQSNHLKTALEMSPKVRVNK